MASLTKTIALLVAACAELTYHTAKAISANPLPFNDVQADGTQVQLSIRGSEHGYWLHDEHGFVVVESKQQYPSSNIVSASTGDSSVARPSYVYAMVDGKTGELQTTEYAVGRVSPFEVADSIAHKSSPAAREAIVSAHRRQAQTITGASAQQTVSDSTVTSAGASAAPRPCLLYTSPSPRD